MKVRYLESARDDIAWFRNYYGRVFPSGKGNARARLQGVIQLISEHPNVGHPPEDFKDALEYPIRKTPFTMIYRIKGNELQVLRVLDQRGGFFNQRRRHP